MDHLISRIARGRLSVFLFHKVPPKADSLFPGDLDITTVERTLGFIADRLDVIPLDEAVRRLPSGRLPARPACITFDDGYAEWITGAMPLLERMGLHATFFITTGQYGGQPMWHERIANAIRAASSEQIHLTDSGLPPLPTATMAEKAATVARLERHLKYQSLVFRDEMLEQLELITGADSRKITSMTIAQLRQLDSRGFGIGAHTVNHPILRFCDSQSTAFELGSAKETLEGVIGRRITGFAYPNGRPEVDFSANTIRFVKSVGYEYAMTTDWGVADSATPLHQIPRFTPWGPNPMQMNLQIIRNLMTKPVCLPE